MVLGFVIIKSTVSTDRRFNEMNIAEWTSQRILFFCYNRKITVNKLAALSGLSQSTVDSIIKRKSKDPHLSTLIKICEGLNIPLKEFFNDPLLSDLEYD